ncbi:PspC domain-containing protein [Halalkalibacter krulwichiae]|uniref:DNA-binding transcriptional activator PspC n=1 Tax=Halalkalibacter krulwichiae TaxID=199441 RepID=A0A1X9MF46_9BACI|nr:PspC domain-containing protein [Halalkalibacter krulwichiae]ARK32058.1 DNA-binding transcriptional activator PspC [Halalkalibacter krulwichiae]
MKRLYRSQYDRKIAGICGGLANYMNIDATLVRLLAVILFFVSGVFPFIIGYIIAVFIIPNEEDVRE